MFYQLIRNSRPLILFFKFSPSLYKFFKWVLHTFCSFILLFCNLSPMKVKSYHFTEAIFKHNQSTSCHQTQEILSIHIFSKYLNILKIKILFHPCDGFNHILYFIYKFIRILFSYFSSYFFGLLDQNPHDFQLCTIFQVADKNVINAE